MIRKKNLIIIILTILSFMIGIVYWQIQSIANMLLPLHMNTIYTLPINFNNQKLIEQLEQKHIIPKSIWFDLLLKVQPKLTHFKAGTYYLELPMTVRQLLELLTSGKEVQFPVRFIEGSSLKEWLEELRTAPYLKHTLKNNQFATVAADLKLDIKQLEGSFYPDTYLYTANTSDLILLKFAHARMNKIVDEIWQERMKNLPYKKKQDLITMASIIEKETSIPEERARIASVFINRLRTGMKLQTDPTVIYGIGDKYNGILTRKDLKTPTKYNTYSIKGLPLSPIAMPSRDSLKAAAHPEKTNYLYFVANGKGGHIFTSNLTNHNKAVQAYRLSVRIKNEK